MSSPAMSNVALTVDRFLARDNGCLGYLVADEANGTAWVIDPRLDQVDDIAQAARARGLRVVHVLDTHTHVDHVSGAAGLARRTGADILAHAESKLTHTARRIRGGDTLRLGTRSVRVLDAPGHTPDSLALLVDGHLFTGDALLAGTAGRTDLPGGSASDLFDTFRRFETLPDDTVVHPGHDYGGGAVTTIGAEKARNRLFRERDRASFIHRLSVSAPPPPGMAAIVRRNLGADAPITITPNELNVMLAWTPSPFLLDVRTALEFEGEHIDGARNIPLEELEARLGEVPSDPEVLVVCRTGIRAAIAAASMVREGRRVGVLDGGMHAWRRASLPVRAGRKRLPIDRQVQLIAGSMMLTALGLGTFVSPWFLLVAAFVAAGLMVAGATGTCGLALLLVKMPWNRMGITRAESASAVCAVGADTPGTCEAPRNQAR